MVLTFGIKEYPENIEMKAKQEFDEVIRETLVECWKPRRFHNTAGQKYSVSASYFPFRRMQLKRRPLQTNRRATNRLWWPEFDRE